MKNIALGMTLIAVAVVMALVSQQPGHTSSRPAMKHCKFDEAAGGPCVWDARHMGNGEGRSFRLTSNDTVVFVSHRRAHRLAYR